MSDLKQTDLSKRLRAEADGQFTPQVFREDLRAAADEIDRYYTGMLNWKATAEAKDREFADRRTQPEATAPAQDLSAAILALPLPTPSWARDHHGENEVYIAQDLRNLLKAAAALASSANALSAGDIENTPVFNLLKRAIGVLALRDNAEAKAIAADARAILQSQKDGHA